MKKVPLVSPTIAGGGAVSPLAALASLPGGQKAKYACNGCRFDESPASLSPDRVFCSEPQSRGGPPNVDARLPRCSRRQAAT